MRGVEEQVLYREEVLAIMGALADILVGVNRIQNRLSENGDEEEEEENDA